MHPLRGPQQQRAWPVESPVVWAQSARDRRQRRRENAAPPGDAVTRAAAASGPVVPPTIAPWVGLAVLLHLDTFGDVRRRVWARAYRRQLWRVGAPLEEQDAPPYPDDDLSAGG